MDEREVSSNLILTSAVPAARFDGLVVTESGDEVLVYDKQRHQIHHLNRTSAVIWRLCNGERSVAGIAQEADSAMDSMPAGIVNVQLALIKLEEAHLLEGPLSPGLKPKTQSRRKLMKRLTLAGAGIAVVTSITAHAASAAACPSQVGNQCSTSSLGCTCCDVTPNKNGCPGGHVTVCVAGLIDACVILS